MDNGRKIPIKNYFILIGVFIGVILFTVYINKWIIAYKKVSISVSPMVDSVSQLSMEDLDIVLSETNKVIVYISYTGDKDIYNLDGKIAKTINKYNYNDYVYYLDVTDYLENENYINLLGIKYNKLSDQINKAPMFIYYKNGEAIAVKDSNKKLVSSNTLIDMIELFDIVE